MFSRFHTTYDTQEDPYRSVQLLGQGGSGSVDEVVKKDDITQTPYARKRFIFSFRNRDRRTKEVAEEARIVRRLQHRHVVRVICTYIWKNQFSIVMSPIADMNLQQFLQQADELAPGQEKQDMRDKLLQWPDCLVRALDYTHEMRVKHRDIKPSNILLRGNTIYLADFGIAKEVADCATTGSYAAVGPFTPSYSAPELFVEDARRGRAIDVYSLGCVFLEMCTVVIGPQGSLGRLRQVCVAQSGSRIYAQNTRAVLNWIWYLWDHWCSLNPSFRELGWHDRYEPAQPGFAFLMMDPDPTKRITSRQLIAVMMSATTDYFDIDDEVCDSCEVDGVDPDKNLPLHSRFHDIYNLIYPVNPEYALKVQTAGNWEDAKRLWLEHHVWWD